MKKLTKDKDKIIYKNFLSLKSKKPKNFEEWEDITKLFNLTKLEIASMFCDMNNPKFELDYIHINNDYLEATNGKIAIRQKLKKGINGKALLQRQFIKALFEGAKLYLSPKKKLFGKRKLCLEHNGKYYITTNNFNYPNFEAIFSKSKFEPFDIVDDSFIHTYFLGGTTEEKLKVILKNKEFLVFDDGVLDELGRKGFTKTIIRVGVNETYLFTTLYLACEGFEIVTIVKRLEEK